MRIVIIAIGRLKAGPERELLQRYVKRFDGLGRGIGMGSLSLVEISESKAGNETVRKREEAKELLSKVPAGATLIALDETGSALSSIGLSDKVGSLRDAGTATLVCAIGGPDGHGQSLLEAAQLRLSLGPMTLPHGLARVVLAEQLYRSATILAGHPYHRA